MMIKKWRATPFLTQRYLLMALMINSIVLVLTLLLPLSLILAAVPETVALPEFMEAQEWGLFAGILLLLFILDSLLLGRDIRHLPRRQAWVYAIIRLSLAMGAIMLGQYPYMAFLFYPVIFFTYFAVGQSISYAIVIIAFAFSFVPPPGVPLVERMPFSFIMFYNLVLGTILTLMLAKALKARNNLYEELAQSHQQLQDYADQVAEVAAADERNRLARDIHDSLGHHLTAISIQLEKAIAYQDRDSSQSAEALYNARRTTREALQEVRQSVGTLRQANKPFNLTAALQDLIQRMEHHQLYIDLNITGDETRFSTFAQMTLYRLVQEGLTNIHKHAGATQANITIHFMEQKIAARISDNGRGFDPIGTRSNGHYGLQGIRERIALVDGTFNIDSSPDAGTTLTASIPKGDSG
ncbi:MAG: sensor histidine kinase [Candidatus Promineifilaceae bacterium]|nr:sensor histidine kinase [Candidatus Promineifilaceae bacterium]